MAERKSDFGNASILGTGVYLPERIVSNTELVTTVPFSGDWILNRTGIESRRIATEKECTSDLAAAAAENALRSSGVEAQEIDLLIVATITPDRLLPSTAAIVREKIGALKSISFDLNAACSGFVFALDVAEKFIRMGQARYALVIAADTLSRFTATTDPKNYILFGDGAGAALLHRGNGNEGIKGSLFGMDTKYPADWLTIHVGSEFVGSKAGGNGNLPLFSMNGAKIFHWAVKTVPKSIQSTLDKYDISMDDIRLIIPHQANKRIITAVADRLNIPLDKFMLTIDIYGNTSAASIPIALDKAIAEDKLKRGDLFMLVGFGGGLAWGNTIIEL